MCVGFIFASAKWQVVALFLVFGVFYAIDESQSKAYITDMEKTKRGTAIGAYSFFTVSSIFQRRSLPARCGSSARATPSASPGSRPQRPSCSSSRAEPDPSIQGRSAEKTPRAPQRMMPAIKTTRATFTRRVRPTASRPWGQAGENDANDEEHR